MNSYWVFDIERFLKDSRGWARKIKELKEKRDDLLGLSALSQDTPVQTSNVSDTTGNTAADRDEYTPQIKELEHTLEVRDSALEWLSPKQRDAIDVFFFSRKQIGYGIDMFCQRWKCQRTDTYETRRKALEILSGYISVRL